MGAMDGLSIGFVTQEASRDAATGTRTIHKADLMEISLVTFPANEMARIDSVKAADDISDERSFERFLRASGFSRSRAKTITAKGFKCKMSTAKKENTMISQEQEIAGLVEALEHKTKALNTNYLETKAPRELKLQLNANEQTKWLDFDPGGSYTNGKRKVYVTLAIPMEGRAGNTQNLRRSGLEYNIRFWDPRTGNLRTERGIKTRRGFEIAGPSKVSFFQRVFESPVSLQFKTVKPIDFTVSVR